MTPAISCRWCEKPECRNECLEDVHARLEAAQREVIVERERGDKNVAECIDLMEQRVRLTARCAELEFQTRRLAGEHEVATTAPSAWALEHAAVICRNCEHKVSTAHALDAAFSEGRRIPELTDPEVAVLASELQPAYERRQFWTDVARAAIAAMRKAP